MDDDFDRIDSSLMMSTNAGKSSEDVKTVTGLANRGNKSSDRLHRLAGGSSSTSLSQHKRSKSHSQLMNVAAASNKKKKNKEEKEDDEDGWTSSSQKGTPEQSGSPKSDSGEEDQGLVMKSKSTKKVEKHQDQSQEATTPKNRDTRPREQQQPKGTLKRDDTQVTLRGFETTTTPNTVNFPSGSSPIEKQQRKGQGEVEAVEVPEEMTHTQTGSDDTLAQDEISAGQVQVTNPNVSAEKRPSLDRGLSTASTKTLMADDSYVRVPTSPASVRSRMSRTSLYPREPQRTAAPKLTTHYALAGGLGSLQEDSELEQMMLRRRHVSEAGIPSSKSEALHLKEYREDNFGSSSSRRKSSISSIRSNMINLPTASPSMADISVGAVRTEHSQQGSSGQSAIDSMHRASHSGFRPNQLHQSDRRRTLSTQSLSATDAAKLATKLRVARGESFDEAHPTSASKLLSNSNSKYFTITNRNDQASTKALKEYNKPTVSVFVKRLGERKNIEVEVESGSLFDDHFSRAKLGGSSSVDKGGKAENDDQKHDKDDQEPPKVRYVMDFGLSGPTIQKTQTTEALLSTLLDHDEFEATWAPALANAAGLGEGTRRAREAARDGGPMDSLQLNGLTSAGGVAVNGPNATPMHFLHGLTNTTDAPFPLDPSDMASNLNDVNTAAVVEGEYLDAKNLRAIAMTWTALNVNKSHVVTRRYVDPMRESLERVARASGMLGSKQSSSQHHHGHYSSNLNSSSGTTTPGGSLRWGGWRSLFSEHHTLQEEA